MRRLNSVPVESAPFAMCSDLHASPENLETMLLELPKFVKYKIFLGDVADEGTQPKEAIQYISDMDVCIIGNHDRKALLRGTNLTVARENIDLSADEIEILSQCKHRFERKNYLFLHSSPLGYGYHTMPEHAKEVFKVEPNFDFIFAGHTHVPQIFYRDKRTDEVKYMDIDKEQEVQVFNLDSKSRQYFITAPSLSLPRWQFRKGYMVLQHLNEKRKRLTLKYL